MSLGFSKTSNEEFLPSFRVNVISGDIVVVGSKKNEDGQTWDKYENQVNLPSKFVADLENIEIGWIHFSAQGPSFALGKVGQPMPAKPSDLHKQGFRIAMFSKEHGLVHFANSSNTVKDVMNDIHDAFLAAKDKNAGKLPVLEFKGLEKFTIKSKEGNKNLKRPVVVISGWVEKPEGMKLKEAEPPKTTESEDSDDF